MNDRLLLPWRAARLLSNRLASSTIFLSILLGLDDHPCRYPDGKVGVDPVCILGLNTNKGQRIQLRLRTDDLRGFRKYQTVKDVLCHELTHNVWSDHDNNFKAMVRTCTTY